MKRLRSSSFLNDLYRDLRDKRLLLPIAALAVAIVAVPMVIGGGAESAAPPPAPAPLDADAGDSVAPAVLTSDPGVRDYRKRLAKLKESNPFAQKFALPDPEKTALESVGGTSDSADSTSGGSVSSASVSGGGSDATITDTVTETSTSTSSGPSSSVTETTQTTETNSQPSHDANQPKPEVRFYAGTIDVTVGPLGDAKRIDNVRTLDLLPSDKAPVAAFLGLAKGGDGAVFSVSRDVAETDGDGSCAPKKPAPCQFVTLATGDQETFKLADGTTFRLRLLHTHIVRVPDPRAQQGADQATSSDG
jgi:hypothetical protein